MMIGLTHLQRLEAGTIFMLFREVVATSNKPGEALVDRCAEGALSGATAVSVIARGHDVEILLNDRIPQSLLKVYHGS